MREPETPFDYRKPDNPWRPDATGVLDLTPELLDYLQSDGQLRISEQPGEVLVVWQGPAPDPAQDTLDAEATAVLRDLAAWYEVNGAAIWLDSPLHGLFGRVNALLARTEG